MIENASLQLMRLIFPGDEEINFSSNLSLYRHFLGTLSEEHGLPKSRIQERLLAARKLDCFNMLQHKDINWQSPVHSRQEWTYLLNITSGPPPGKRQRLN